MSLRGLYDVPAPAKINHFLHIVGQRADGYHLLQSLFALIDWADTLHFERRDDGLLQRHDLGPALPADDLCLRAARLLQAESGCTLGADISIDKHVPWGAGLGGGSSDAASTLLALNRLWSLHWPRQRLLPLAARLGADVPFFVGGHNAFVEGVGETLTPVLLQPQWLAVVKPSASISTREIFEHPALVRDTEAATLAGLLADGPGLHGCGLSGATVDVQVANALASGYGRNDLQPPALDRCPEVAQAAGWLEARFGNSRMTGSGSAVFARAGSGDQPAAELACQQLPKDWVGRMCRSLPSHPLVGWAAG